MKAVCACANQSLKNMDFKSPLFGDGEKKQFIHRTCLGCGMHWYGEEGKERAYTRREFAEIMEGAA